MSKNGLKTIQKYQESFEELAIAIQMKLNWLSCNEHRVIGSDNKNNYA